MNLAFQLTSDTLLNGIILVLVLAAIVVVISLLMKKKGPEPAKPPSNLMDKKIDERRQTLPMQLQAYERLTLLMDRVDLINLVKRVDGNGMTVQQQQFQLGELIRQEYEHNITQQLYVSDDSWFLIKSAIEGNISTINNVAGQQKPDATGQDLNRAILNYVLGTSTISPAQSAINQMRIDVGQIV